MLSHFDFAVWGACERHCVHNATRRLLHHVGRLEVALALGSRLTGLCRCRHDRSLAVGSHRASLLRHISLFDRPTVLFLRLLHSGWSTNELLLLVLGGPIVGDS